MARRIRGLELHLLKSKSLSELFVDFSPVACRDHDDFDSFLDNSVDDPIVARPPRAQTLEAELKGLSAFRLLGEEWMPPFGKTALGVRVNGTPIPTPSGGLLIVIGVLRRSGRRRYARASNNTPS